MLDLPYLDPNARHYLCLDCGGPRSLSSGKRCRACYQQRSRERKELEALDWPEVAKRDVRYLLTNQDLFWPLARRLLNEIRNGTVKE